ncbi:nSTAND1 domain-containing NTPase [Streptomyces nigra]|uniref:nSTAND1 domain-containing NTPase n=1 Tax=Streptomyces nigra TaxID=1827580 RepID=UPI0036B79C29
MAGPDLLVTCAHVVEEAGGSPGGTVAVSFSGLLGAPQATGVVETASWRDPAGDDVAFLRLMGTPPGVPVLPLGTAEGCSGHVASAYGFPRQGRVGGHFGHVTAGHVLDDTDDPPVCLLQLTDANDITGGFSGSPVVDDLTGLVIGMVTAITPADAQARGLGVAYATPAGVLRQAHPELTEHALRPYPGPEPYRVEQAEFYVGCTTARTYVLQELRKRRRALLLLGPSGSGKSSLVHAGVLPALAEEAVPGSDRWLPLLVPRPGGDALAAAERHGLPGAAADGIDAAARSLLAVRPGHDRILLVIDQFEELFLPEVPGTPVGGPALAHTVAELIAVARCRAVPVTLLLVMRDDFYAQLAAHAPGLLEAVSPPLNIPATLTEDDLRAIIKAPTQRAGMRVETGLTGRIITDLSSQNGSTREGGSGTAPVTALPALQLTLHQLWERRTGGQLTHEAYERIGTVTGAVTTWCATAFDQLPVNQHEAARRILTALVQPADAQHGVPATRRRVPLTALHALVTDPTARRDAPSPGDEARTVLAALTRHRVVTTHSPASANGAAEPVAELAHDSLVREWPDLRAWVAQDEDFQRWLGRTEEQHRRWQDEHEKHSGLLRGRDLAESADYARHRGLPAPIRRYVKLSSQRARLRVRVLVGLLILALSTAALAGWQWHNATLASKKAISRQLAAESQQLEATQPDLANLLAVYAYRTHPTAEAAASLIAANETPLIRSFASHHGQLLTGMVFSPDRRTLATASADRTVQLWDTRSGRAFHNLTGHTDSVTGVAFSPDRRTLATTSEDGTARLWNTRSGRALHVLKHTEAVGKARFIAGGRMLITASFDGTVRLWDTRTGRALYTLKPSSRGTVVFSPDGRTLATSGGVSTVQLWDTRTGRALHTLTGQTGTKTSVVFSPDSQMLATEGFDGTVRLLDSRTGRAIHTLTEHTLQTNVVFSPDGRTLTAFGGGGGTAQLWDTRTGRPLYTLTSTRGVEGLVFSPDGRTLATSGGGIAQLWDTRTGQALHTLTSTYGAGSPLFSPDGRTLATSGGGIAQLWDTRTGQAFQNLTGHTEVNDVVFSPDGRTLATRDLRTARLWDTRRHTPVTLTGHTYGLTDVLFSPDGRTLATASFDGTARLWDTRTGQALHTLTGHSDDVTGVAFSPDGRTLATASYDGTARLWDTRTGRSLRTLRLSGDVTGVVFSPDGRTLATVDGTARLWDSRTGQALHTLTEPHGLVTGVVFSPDGRTLATAGTDRTARLWDTRTGQALHTLAGHPYAVAGVAISSDGRTLATRTDFTAWLWDTGTGQHLHTLTGHTDAVTDVEFSPDGQAVATASHDGTARLWDALTGQPRRTLAGHNSAVIGVTFSPDGRTLATASADGTARLWPMDVQSPEDGIRKICARVGRDLTTKERAQYIPNGAASRGCDA